MLDFEYDVVICTYNGSKYIEQQLISILNQKLYRPKRIIISDDCSTDNTLELAQNILLKDGFVNYSFVKNPRKGVVSNFFYGISLSESNYIFLSDQDDIWDEYKVSAFAKEFKRLDVFHNTFIPKLVFSDAVLIDESNREISSSFFYYQGISEKFLLDDSIIYKNCVQGASCAIDKNLRKVLLESLLIVEEKNLYMHDWWLALLAKYFGVYSFINKPLLKYRQHSLNQIGARNRRYKYLNYIVFFNKYFSSFIKAINQRKELFLFYSYYSPLDFQSFMSRKKRYSYISIIKKIFLRFIC